MGKASERLGYKVVDLQFKDGDINSDISDWNYHQYEARHFDIIWVSPTCIEHNKPKTTRTKKINEANKIIGKTVAFIEDLQP